MGVFDTVRFVCPECGEGNEIQTKDGGCTLRLYNQTSVPVEIAASMIGRHFHCDNCEYPMEIRGEVTRNVRLEVV